MELEVGPLRFGIIGAGKLGLAIGNKLQEREFELVHVSSASETGRNRASRILGVPAYEDPLAVCNLVDCVLICVPDDAVSEVVNQLVQRSSTASPLRLRYVSTSASAGLDPLAPLANAGHEVAVLHPVASFSDLEGSAEPFDGATGIVSADSEAARVLAHALAHAMSLRAVEVETSHLPLHAAACTVAATFTRSMMSMVNELGRAAGISEDISTQIYGALAHNTHAALTRGQSTIGEALRSGPVARGDSGALATQLRAVRQNAPGMEEFFDAGLTYTINDLVMRGIIEVETARRLSATLGSVMQDRM